MPVGFARQVESAGLGCASLVRQWETAGVGHAWLGLVEERWAREYPPASARLCESIASGQALTGFSRAMGGAVMCLPASS